MSTTSSRITCPSLSRSNTWKASRISRNCAGGILDNVSPSTPLLTPIIFAIAFETPVSLRGNTSGSRLLRAPLCTNALSSAVCDRYSFDGDVSGVWAFSGELVGVLGRIVVLGEEGVGDSGRRNGEVRGEPKDSGEGL